MVVGGPVRDLGHDFRVELQSSFIFRELFRSAGRVVLAVAFFISKGHLLGDGIHEALIFNCCADGRGAEEERSHRAHAALRLITAFVVLPAFALEQKAQACTLEC